MEIRRLLVSNRSEIATRVFRTASELGIKTIAVYAKEDRLSFHRFVADEAYQVGRDMGPLEAYLSVDEVIRVAKEARADAIHPGYGFLSESPEFAEACLDAGIKFIGPTPETLRTLGNKIDARNLAKRVGVPVMPATPPLPDNIDVVRHLAQEIGYPVMLKASWGGGGRGMRPIEEEAALIEAVMSARRESKAAFGKDEVYLEKLVRRARHVEVQILGDMHGGHVHVFERDCSIQRRNQKIIERAPAPYLDPPTRQALCESALRIASASNYVGAGTVEFLLDADSGLFYFIEVNPRIQVEHTVTEQVTGLDIVKAQIRIAEGGRLGRLDETGIPPQSRIGLNGHALQCRVTTESPENNFVPDFGRISAYRGASGPGIRVDNGTAYSGAIITSHYDSLLEKIIAWAPSPEEAVDRMRRALKEYRIQGVATNLTFLAKVLAHPKFQSNDYTTKFIDNTVELINTREQCDESTKLLTYIADVTVNGRPEVRGRAKPRACTHGLELPSFPLAPITGTKQILAANGPRGFASWLREQDRVLITDTTMRDAHQSLLATRVRTYDLAPIASAYASGMPQLLSLECWGGATFDVAMRFLSEDPWDRLRQIAQGAPNILTQMLLRGANGVGYTNYPDNVVRSFIRQACNSGMDLFRIFDCFNWVENMRIAIDAVAEHDKLAEGAICYTGDITDPDRVKYSLGYYVDLAKELERAGCHILGIKDMAGLLKPAAARVLVKALRDEVGLPIHLHTHDTSGLAAATVMAAVEAGVDAVDAAMDSLSGVTSQPCLGAIVEGLRCSIRDTQLNPDAIRRISLYWETVRTHYAAFESEQRSGAAEVYLHEIPGGQITNLKEQAKSLGLDGNWHDVASAYRAANDLFGDIIKVTPSSKVVGDMALVMVAQGLSPVDVLDPKREIVFPESVVEMLRGYLGQPPGGWPEALQRKALKGQEPITVRPGSLLGEADLESIRAQAIREIGRDLSDEEFASYLMYPKIFPEYCATVSRSGPISQLPTPVFFYGMMVGEEISVRLGPGKAIVISLLGVGETDEKGNVAVDFALNGQPQTVKVQNRASSEARPSRRQAEEGNDAYILAPMPGSISSVAVQPGQEVRVGDVLLAIEAMKMETVIHATRAGVVAEVLVQPGQSVEARDLLVMIQN